MKFPTHAGRHAIGPGALDQNATRKRIACLGNSGAPDGASGRVFARHQAEIGHQLASIGEASKVTDFGHNRDRDDESDPAHRAHTAKNVVGCYPACVLICKIWYSISQTVSDLGNIHDRSIRAVAVKPRAFGAPLSGNPPKRRTVSATHF